MRYFGLKEAFVNHIVLNDKDLVNPKYLIYFVLFFFFIDVCTVILESSSLFIGKILPFLLFYYENMLDFF